METWLKNQYEIAFRTDFVKLSNVIHNFFNSSDSGDERFLINAQKKDAQIKCVVKRQNSEDIMKNKDERPNWRRSLLRCSRKQKKEDKTKPIIAAVLVHYDRKGCLNLPKSIQVR